MKTFFWKVRSFFEIVPGALRGHLNVQELARITVTALSAGGGVFGLLSAILLEASTLFPAPTDAAFATVVLTTILEAHRRLNQGEVLPLETARRGFRR